MKLQPMQPEDAVPIAKTRDLVCKLGHELAARDVHEDHILTGIVYGLQVLACASLGSPEAAIEWQRTALDLFERQHMGGGNAETH